MTQTIDSAVTPEVKLTAVTPQERVDAWLADFESALAAHDLFAAEPDFESYLVDFRVTGGDVAGNEARILGRRGE